MFDPSPSTSYSRHLPKRETVGSAASPSPSSAAGVAFVSSFSIWYVPHAKMCGSGENSMASADNKVSVDERDLASIADRAGTGMWVCDSVKDDRRSLVLVCGVVSGEAASWTFQKEHRLSSGRSAVEVWAGSSLRVSAFRPQSTTAPRRLLLPSATYTTHSVALRTRELSNHPRRQQWTSIATSSWCSVRFPVPRHRQTD